MSRLIAICLSVLFWSGAAHAETVLITGANRGIGLEFVRQYAARGWAVVAAVRNPNAADDLKTLSAKNPNIAVEQLDVADQGSINRLATKYEGQSIDVLINNAGLLGELNRQKLDALDAGEFQQMMAVNAFGPLAVSAAFRGHVARSTQKKIIAISSGNGAISDTRIPGGLYFYRSSKAALNIMMRGLASDLAPMGIAVGVLAPGGVDTDMGRAAGGAARPQNLPPSVSVAGMIKVIDALKPENSHLFYKYDGSTRAW